ncbi:hypothetical protein VKT23_011419 [Stygiomarasmius scandens]|uniref:WLM-domain-containing protein n=1 Tax=Marasmiellus scandens TaxID=2682957 RepID=A0ABR1JBY4_9AGAR
MVHLRLNETEANPNPHVNFITALPTHEKEDQEDARQLLRALAAQVRPVMKAHGFVVNSLEEYEHNSVFAGRNWNNGETVELVLRRPGGPFLPTSWLMSTLCHELAHIKHMNHGPAFQALWKRLRTEVRQLQDKGYYGDGYWSAGTRLADSARVSGQGIETGDLPEYMCGGAQARARPARKRQSRRPREVVPSNHTGRQTAKPRKAGTRVTSKYAFTGEGTTLGNTPGSTTEKGTGTGFGKRAGSKRAREERALAAERRLRMLQGQPQAGPSTATPESLEDSGEEDLEPETDAERRKMLHESESSDLSGLNTRTSWNEFDDEFIFTRQDTSDAIEISSDQDFPDSCDVASGLTFVTGGGGDKKGKRKRGDDRTDDDGPSMKTAKTSGTSKPVANVLGNFVRNEVDYRKKEALGLTPASGHGRTIGGTRSSSSLIPSIEKWTCLICTLENEPQHLACSACGMERGKESWSGI